MKNILVKGLAVTGIVGLLFGTSLAPASAVAPSHPDIPGMCWVFSGGGYLGAACPVGAPIIQPLPTVPVVPLPTEPIFTEVPPLVVAVPPVVVAPVQTAPVVVAPVFETKAQKENRKAAEKAAKNLAKSLRNK